MGYLVCYFSRSWIFQQVFSASLSETFLHLGLVCLGSLRFFDSAASHTILDCDFLSFVQVTELLKFLEVVMSTASGKDLIRQVFWLQGFSVRKGGCCIKLVRFNGVKGFSIRYGKFIRFQGFSVRLRKY